MNILFDDNKKTYRSESMRKKNMSFDYVET